MRRKTLLLLCPFIVLMLVYFLHYKIKKFSEEKFSQKSIKVQFLKKIELDAIISKKMYYKTFSKIDLKVRNVKNIKEYISKITLETDNLTIPEKKRILHAILMIEKKTFLMKNIKFPGLDITKFIKIPWKVGITNGNSYENGISHTREGVIIFSRDVLSNYSENKLLLTLAHEKTHIYQRMYPDKIRTYLKARGFSSVCRRSHDKLLNLRANPDINEFMYADSKGIELSARYIKNPSRITDVKFSQSSSQHSEHPYEFMALEIENIFK
jgi:hypothetical protein